ncbi:hemerythrin domain-containing protein [Streptomyces zagrosensis]|uniref:Hemerythrin superfamily protein n=1 Tax=Streptomyces zagrosensis TaxID=1042984 RepID=A0A7W9QC30_9ACTN|nr:hemerythrin domain-containing protein [Streptomyces zagrosensis]MBB5937385.1 hemerythrin superfamily protein [Streptomyces zagrosensis]
MTIMPEGQRDALEVLTSDHREVERLFAAYQGSTDAEQRRQLIDRVTIALVQHAVAEEEYLYPALRTAIPHGDQVADAELARQSAVEETLNSLDDLNPAHERFEALVRQLMDEVSAHIRSEEDTIFPQLATHLSAEQRMGLGLHLLSAKRTAPTHPHPEAPDKPPLNKLINPGVALVDRVRDWLSGRTR